MTATSPAFPLPRTFWTYLAGLVLTALGDAAVAIALPFLVLASGGGAQDIGLVVLAGSLPRFLAPLLGGLADRLPTRPLLLWSGLGRATAVGLVGLVALGGPVPLLVTLALAFLNGLFATLTYTAGSALVPRVVPAARLVRANSLISGALMGMPLVGYGLGGLLVHLLGAAGTLLLSVPFILSLALAALTLPALRAAAHSSHIRPFQDFREGLDTLRGSPPLLGLLGMSFALNLALNVMNVRAPLHMAQHGRGAPDYAIFEMVISGSVLAGISLVTPLLTRFSLDSLIGAGRWVLVAGTLGFAFSPVAAWWAAAAVFGLGLGLVEVVATTRSQHLVPAEVRGRVVGSLMGVNAVGLSLGAGLAAGPLDTSRLMLGLGLTLALLALSWPLALRQQKRSAAAVARSSQRHNL